MARKGVELLAPIMRELGEGFELHYTGGAAAEKDKPSMPATMHDIGRLSGFEVVAAMQNSDAFLFPSRSEGLPLVAIEAMACGLAVIASRASSLPEVVEDGFSGTGLLCQGGDASSYAQAVRSLAGAPDVAVLMGQRSRARVLSDFSSDRMVEAYLDMYLHS